ncbi:MAG: hypothetical protein ACTSYX_04825 [Candidatus Thorarchaeota archaeon]
MPEIPSEFNSVIRLREFIRRAVGDTEAARVKDYKTEAVELREQLVELVQGFNLPFFVTLLEIEGGVFPLVISEFSITGSDRETLRKKIVEFRDHRWKQRTFMPYFAKETSNATWGVFTHLADYYYYIGVPEDYENLEIARYKKKVAPIFWLSASDGQCEAQENNILHALYRDTPDAEHVYQANKIYDADLASQLIHKNTLLTREIIEKEKEIENMENQADWIAKEKTFRLANMLLQVGKLQNQSLKDKVVYLFTKTSMKYLFWVIIAILCYMGFAMIMNAWFNVGLPLPIPSGGETGGGGGGGGTPTPYQP